MMMVAFIALVISLFFLQVYARDVVCKKRCEVGMACLDGGRKGNFCADPKSLPKPGVQITKRLIAPERKLRQGKSKTSVTILVCFFFFLFFCFLFPLVPFCLIGQINEFDLVKFWL